MECASLNGLAVRSPPRSPTADSVRCPERFIDNRLLFPGGGSPIPAGSESLMEFLSENGDPVSMSVIQLLQLLALTFGRWAHGEKLLSSVSIVSRHVFLPVGVSSASVESDSRRPLTRLKKVDPMEKAGLGGPAPIRLGTPPVVKSAGMGGTDGEFWPELATEQPVVLTSTTAALPARTTLGCETTALPP